MGTLSRLLGATCLLAASGEAAAQTVPSPGLPEVAATAPTATPAQVSAPETPATIDDIIVTASRRSESVRQVPTAVSAFAGARLRDAQIVNLDDLAAITPNVQISTYLTNANINIRGVGNGNFVQVGGDPGVAVHKNGVYLGQASLALSTLLDVERVEVLRGPQGTLFGRNATGGAVNIIPKAPTDTLSYGIDVTVGIDPTLLRSAGYLSGPLDASGSLLARVSVEQNYNRGFTRNGAPVGPARLDDNDDMAARGQLEWRATENFNVRLLAEYQRRDDNGPAAFLLGNPTGTAVVFPDPLNPIVLQPGFPTGDPRSRTAYANVGARKMDSKSADLTADWTLGGGSLKALLSHGDSYSRIVQDGDGTAVAFTSTAFTNRANQEYGELIYTSDAARPFTYILGANAYDEHLTQDSLIPTSGYTTLFPVYSAGGVVDTRSYGVFVHAQFVVRPGSKVFGGLRYSHDRKRISEYFNLRSIFVPGAPATNADRDTWGNVSYDVGLSHDFARTVTGYVKYATGYKSGGYSISSFNPPFEQETNSNIEVGLKGSFLNGALQSNIAAFHMKYRNLQVTQVQGLISAVTNAARATIDGAEIEVVAHPGAGIRVEANGSWLKSRFDDFTTLDSARPTLGPIDLTGNTLAGAPRFSGSIGVFDDIRLSQGTVTPGVRYDWKDRIYFSEFNIPISSQRAGGKLDLFLNYKTEDQRWTASLFALNVANRAVKANVVVVSALLGSLAVGQYQPGRQVGVSLGYHF